MSMYDAESKSYVLKLLNTEPIRYCDGRYSTGFKDVGMLTEMISDGTAEVFDNNGVRFVRRVTPPKDYHGYADIITAPTAEREEGR
jgi:hypothetical protein